MSGEANSKMSEPRVQLALAVLREGGTLTAAAGVVEVHRATLYSWMKRSATFRDAVKDAEGQAEAKYVHNVAKAADSGIWQASAWMLERRWPEKYGARTRIDLRVEIAEEVRRMASERNVTEEQVWSELREMGIAVPH